MPTTPDASTLPPTDPKHQEVPGAGRLGMILFIISLSMLFAASMAGYLAIRLRAEDWPPPGMPALPPGLWLSTILLLLASGTIHIALDSARQDRQAALRAALIATLILGLAFLTSQTLNWASLVAAHLTARTNLYGFTFYMLTGLHAAHVLGGLVLLGVVTARARRGRYDPHRHDGVLYAAMYWHFLDAVWIVMFAVLYLAG